MDAARTYEKFLGAKVRAELLKSLVSEHREESLKQVSYDRLPAGGRITPSAAFSCQCVPESKKSHACACDEPIPSGSDNPKPKKLKEKKKKSENKCKCRCKQPVIVVPSKRRLETDKKGNGYRCNPLGCCKPRKRNKRASTDKIEVENCASTKSLRPEKSKASKQSIKSPNRAANKKVGTANGDAKCSECEKIPDMSQELLALKKKLEDQVAQEVQQKEHLNEINNKLMMLCVNVNTLNEKCKDLENEKDKLIKQGLDDKCECTKNASVKSIRHKDGSGIERKVSSLCQFCKDKNLPVLSSMQYALFKMMGKRCFTDIALTILLRADNVYHVNVRELETGSALGCLLVNDAGITEANNLGLFQEILTFCVIDVRNTINSKETIFGGINFEIVRKKRLLGGCFIAQLEPSVQGLPEEQQESDDTPTATQVDLGEASSSKINKTESRPKTKNRKRRLSIPQVIFETISQNSSQSMINNATQLPSHSTKNSTLTHISSEYSDTDFLYSSD